MMLLAHTARDVRRPVRRRVDEKRCGLVDKVRKERRVHVTLDCWLEATSNENLCSLLVYSYYIDNSILTLIAAMHITISQYSPPAQCQAEAASLRLPA